MSKIQVNAATRAREWMARVLLAFGIPLLMFGALEGALRLIGYGFDPSFFIPLEDGRHTTNERFGWRYFDPSLARVPVPTAISKSKPPNTYRVFVLGGSAAMGTPDEAYGMPRFLEVALARARPNQHVEVVNAAMTAINSHVVRDIARACADFDADAFVIYVGHNEVVGPFGAGTVFTGTTSSLPMIRAGLWLRTTRVGQWAQAIGRSVSRQRRGGAWGGMEMFLENQVPADAPGLLRVYDHFRANLLEVCDTAIDAGATVVLSTMVTNVRDCAPFASVSRSSIAENARFVAAMAANDFTRAVSIDSTHAEAHYRLARDLEAQRNLEAAAHHFRRARDLDTLRFRADATINDIIRDVAGSRDGVTLVDAAAAAEARAAELGKGGPGEEALYEHVHLNADGNWALARLIAEALVPGATVEGTFADALGYTTWSDWRQIHAIRQMLAKPPFTNQFNHGEVSARWDTIAAAARDRGGSREAMIHALSAVTAALDRDPVDLFLLEKQSELHLELEDLDRALDGFRTLATRQPRKLDWLERLGYTWEQLGDRTAAREVYEQILEVNPHLAPIHVAMARVGDDPRPHFERALEINPRESQALYGLGALAHREGRTEDARALYLRAIEVEPRCVPCRNQLVALLVESGDIVAAGAQLEQVVALNPENARAWNNLGTVYARLGRKDQAADAYRQAVLVDPTYEEARSNLERVTPSAIDE